MAKMFEIHGHHGQSPKFSVFNAFLCDNFFESGHGTLKLRKSHGHWFLNMATLATPWSQLATLNERSLSLEYDGRARLNVSKFGTDF